MIHARICRFSGWPPVIVVDILFLTCRVLFACLLAGGMLGCSAPSTSFDKPLKGNHLRDITGRHVFKVGEPIEFSITYANISREWLFVRINTCEAPIRYSYEFKLDDHDENAITYCAGGCNVVRGIPTFLFLQPNSAESLRRNSYIDYSCVWVNLKFAGFPGKGTLIIRTDGELSYFVLGDAREYLFATAKEYVFRVE